MSPPVGVAPGPIQQSDVPGFLGMQALVSVVSVLLRCSQRLQYVPTVESLGKQCGCGPHRMGVWRAVGEHCEHCAQNSVFSATAGPL